MISLFLGAGFSAPAGCPLASELFDTEVEVDRVVRQNLVGRVLARWQYWHESTGGQPEEYLAYLQEQGDKRWLDAQWYVSLLFALRMGRIVVGQRGPRISRHYLSYTTGIDAHESFWTAVLAQTADICVITTNYDILPERGLRLQPRPRVHRYGFQYGEGPEQLEGHGIMRHRYRVRGSVPLLKLHGSISWSYDGRRLHRFYDCRPAIRGDAVIVAPVTNKTLPRYLEATWRRAEEVLSQSHAWLVIGYSLPEYDQLVRQLLVRSASHEPAVHVFDPSNLPTQRLRELLPAINVIPHPGLPDCLPQLPALIESLS